MNTKTVHTQNDSEASQPTTDGNSAEEVHPTDLTQFQLNILGILYDEPQYGLAIKRELEVYYGEKINHGRLYPNLDKLAEKGLLTKSEIDKRTNEYELTDEGRRVAEGVLGWFAAQLGLDGQTRPAGGEE